MSLLYEEKTRVLKGMFFEVQNEVGLGRQEEAYHQACVMWLRQHGIPVASKPPHRLLLGEDEAYVLFPDLVLWDSITVELKALPRLTTSGELVQLYDYLKYRCDQIGFLVNLGLDRVVDQRVVYHPIETEWIEDWKYWTGTIQGRDREIGLEVRNGLRFLYRTHGTGYGAEVIERLVLCSMTRLGLKIVHRPVAKAYFRGEEVDESALDCVIIEDRILLVFSALFDDVSFCVNRGLSYMRALGVEWGVAVDFGKKAARITGLRQRRTQLNAHG